MNEDRSNSAAKLVPSGIKKLLASPAFILAVACAIRAAYLFFRIHQPSFGADVENTIGNEAWNIARSIAVGKGFSSPFGAETGSTAWLTPVYPYILVGIFKLFGIASPHSVAAAATLNEAFSAFTVVPIFYIGKRINGRFLAAIAAWLWTIHPLSIYDAYYWLWYTSLSTLLTAVILWATIEVLDSERARIWIGYGLLWGVALLTNAAVMSLAPFVFGWLIWKRRNGLGRGGFGLPGLAAFSMILVCAPWVARNYEIFHQFLPLRSNLGCELLAGNNDGALDGADDNKLFVELGEVPFCQEMGRKATRFLEAHPRVAISLTWGRILETWTGDPHPVWKLMVKGWTRRAELVLYTGLSILALWGLFILFREKSEFLWLLGVHPVVFPLVYYMTHTSFSYRLPIDPVLVVIAAITLADFQHRIVRRSSAQAPLRI